MADPSAQAGDCAVVPDDRRSQGDLQPDTVFREECALESCDFLERFQSSLLLPTDDVCPLRSDEPKERLPHKHGALVSGQVAGRRRDACN